MIETKRIAQHKGQLLAQYAAWVLPDLRFFERQQRKEGMTYVADNIAVRIKCLEDAINDLYKDDQ